MLRWYPYVPVGGEMPLNCAILSYNGRLYFGFSGDVHAAPDLRCLETLLRLSFTELLQATGDRPPRKKKRTKSRPIAREASGEEKISIAIRVPNSAKPIQRASQQGQTPEDKVLTQLVA